MSPAEQTILQLNSLIQKVGSKTRPHINSPKEKLKAAEYKWGLKWAKRRSNAGEQRVGGK